MSHHYSGPDFGFPWGDARLDLTDIYVFPKPSDASRSILIMNVHPSSTVVRPESTTSEPFSPDALYDLMIDTNGDSIADIIYRVRVLRSAGGGQTARMVRINGDKAARSGESGDIIFDETPVSMGQDAQISEHESYRFFAGWRSEPFFFDTLGALNNLNFTGSDFFADKNVCSIVLELPNAALGSTQIGLWARVLAKVDGKWIQAERGARPQQAVFLPGEARAAYLANEPAFDATFVAAFAHTLEHTGGYTPEEAERVAATLLPDIMLYDLSKPVAFPQNGRNLTDDAADVFLSILTNGRVISDGVGHHHDLLDVFPHLGPPHSE
jgi:Domain of unknown function (DUF4331)